MQDEDIINGILVNTNSLSDCKTVEALAMLEALGDPAALKDRFSKFRWHTNHACVALLNADFENAADEFLVAFNLVLSQSLKTVEQDPLL